MAVVNNSFLSFFLTWRQFALVPSCCEISPLSDTSGGLPLVVSLPGSLPCQHLLPLLLIIACLPHRAVSSPLSFRPHAGEMYVRCYVFPLICVDFWPLSGQFLIQWAYP